jgi:hypothetical protein
MWSKQQLSIFRHPTNDLRRFPPSERRSHLRARPLPMLRLIAAERAQPSRAQPTAAAVTAQIAAVTAQIAAVTAQIAAVTA